MKALAKAIVFTLAILPYMQNLDAALYWQHGVRSKQISVCFVGDAVTSRPARVAEILDYISQFQWMANIRFNYWGTCPAATQDANGNDVHDGDYRVVLPSTSVSGTGAVPGTGCPMFLDNNGNYNGGNNGWGSWSNAPDDLAGNRSCVYNLKLGDDPWNDTPYLNHTLHEFGHGLGLSHEHVRNDANANCTEAGYGGSASTGFITPYDRNSVMHYRFGSCSIDGNYGRNGLSLWDELALHIMYPEDKKVAEISGRIVVRSTEQLRLSSTWKVRGANMSFAAKNFLWRINGANVGNSNSLQTVLPVGTHQLSVTHQDFLNRQYNYNSKVIVLTPDKFRRKIVAPIATSVLLH